MFVSPDEVPANRRPAHERALDLLDRHSSTGQPFALVLRTYRFTQLFRDAPEGLRATQVFENVLHDELAQAGLDAVTVQDRGAGTERYFPADGQDDRDFEVRSPALFVQTEGWLSTVEYLIARAGLLVVLLQTSSPGVLQELEKIVEMGRADHTVVVVFGSDLMDMNPIPDLPVLGNFHRVISSHELDLPRIVKLFLLEDLVHDMRAGRTSRPSAMDWRSVAAGYEQLARSERAQRALRAAAESFGRAARVSLRIGDHRGAVRQTTDRAELLEQLDDTVAARAVLRELSEALPPATDGEAGLAHAELDAAVARRMATDGDAAGALELLDRSRAHAEDRDDVRSVSVLRTAEAWIRRGDHDVLGAITAAQHAVAAAEGAGADAELRRSLIVLGVLWDDLGEWSPRGSDAFARAVAAMPESGAEDDMWMVLMTLGRLAARTGDRGTAVRAYLAAAQSGAAAGLPAEARTARERLFTALAEQARAEQE